MKLPFESTGHLEGEREKFVAMVNREFDEFAEYLYEGLRRNAEDARRRGRSQAKTAEEAVAERKKKYESLDLNGRIATLTNNFFCWWPGGYYRTLLQERRSKASPDDERIMFDEKLISDLDEIINGGGYEGAVDLVQNQKVRGDEGDERMRVIGEVYFKMRSKGYERTKLRG